MLMLVLLLLSLPASAQRRGRRAQQPVKTVTPQEAMAAYNFSQAEELLEQQIADLTKKKKPTEQEEALLETVRKSQIRLQATERVVEVVAVFLFESSQLALH